MRLVFTIIISLLSLHCGEHRQSLYNSDAIREDRNTAESDPNKRIFDKIASGDLLEIKNLINNEGVSIEHKDAEGRSLLINAVLGLKYAVVQYLLSEGADIEATDEEGKTALDYASDDVMKQLIRGEVIAASELNALMIDIALKDLNVDLLIFLLERGADPNYNTGRLTPLIFLANRSTPEEEMPQLLQLVEILIAHPQIDIHLKVGRYTAISLAEAKNKSEMVALLSR